MKWVQTCGACPEQYNIFKGGTKVAYFRLRHGWLTVECAGEIVYESGDFTGDGSFLKQKHRAKHMRKAEKKIKKWLRERAFQRFEP